ncbi:MAG: M20/M25/M40 family metallo-hydrolase [Chitinophagaceae bacterium]|nr:M20/M25/M40 family metallo-hydrolase [Chitinophagaceae bacterium]
MNTNKTFVLITALGLFTSCKDHHARLADGSDKINADSIKQYVSVLAADSLLGRKPFTEGETRTIRYLQQQYASLGLEPGNGNSYLQEVPMANIMALAEPVMQVKSKKGSLSLKAGEDYINWTNRTEPEIRLENTPVVFAGYGVVAPEYNWNDYAGLDVKGKLVLVMVNDPGFWSGDTTLFKGRAMTYYGRWTYKFEEAARQGAKGCLIIHNTAAAGYPLSVLMTNFNSTRLQLDERGKQVANSDMIGWIAEGAANKLFREAGYDSTLLMKANLPGFKGLELNLGISTSLDVTVSYNKSYNVIGKITGTKHPDEAIIYTAHWDHWGVGKPDATGDTIYNGAFDNASGVAGLMELARVFKQLDPRPERTIIFLSVTAEEQGLLGSYYYTQNPTVPANKIVANINMDMLVRYGANKDIVLIGPGQSDLEDMLKTEAEQAGRYVGADQHPEAGHYYRSDHINFAKVGVPALYVKDGIDNIAKGKDFGKQLQDDFYKIDYHKPSDEYDPATWTMEGAVNDLKILYRIGHKLAYSETWPKWKEGSEFRGLRK